MEKRIMVKRSSFGLTIIFLMNIMVGQSVSNFGSMTNDRLGTSAAMELLIPVGARDMAMGGAGIATSTGVESIYWNPAGLGRISVKASGLFSNMNYIADIAVNYGAVALNFGKSGVFALSAKAVDYGRILLTTVDDPEGIAGRTFTPNFLNLGFSYARAFTASITAGATVKMFSQNINRVTGKGMAIDIGLQYSGVAGIPGIHLGVVVKNMGPQVSYGGPGLSRMADPEEGRRPPQFFQSQAASFELPSSVEMGLAYDYNISDGLNLTMNGAYAKNNLTINAYKIGGEVTLKLSALTVSGRTGMDMLNTEKFDENIYGPRFGFGLTFETPGPLVTIDYAYRTVSYFDNNSMFSIQLGF